MEVYFVGKYQQNIEKIKYVCFNMVERGRKNGINKGEKKIEH